MADVIENTPANQNVMGSITADGFTVESNFETAEELAAALPTTADPTQSTPSTSATAEAPRRRNRRADPTIAVSAAVGRQREAERLAADSAARIAALEAENIELKKPKQPVPVTAAPAYPSAPLAQPQPVAPAPTEAAYKRYQAMADAPKPEQFTGENAFYEYQYAVGQFIAEKTVSETMQRMSDGARIQKEREKFTTRIASETEKDPTFPQRLNAVDATGRPIVPIDTRIIPWLHAHPMGADVMVHLVNNPNVAQQIAMLPPVDQIGQIGGIVATLKAQSAAASLPASARPAISQAKPPTKRVVGAPPAATDEPPDDNASDEAHEAYWGPRRQEIRSARRAHR